jgi:mRNA interferase RelE/StbE
MVCFTLTWRKSTRKDLRKIPPGEVVKIIGAVEDLARNPFPDGHKKPAATQHAYRIRVGNYRVLYEVLGHVLTIDVIKVAHRKDVYR